MTSFYHLKITGLSACSLEKGAYARAQETWLCAGCNYPKPGAGAVDVTLQNKRPTPSPLTFVMGCGVPVARRDFLSSLGEINVERDLELGRVLGSDGREIEDWATCRGRNFLFVRGASNVSFRCCEVCGRKLYFSTGKKYLFPEPRADFGIFESSLFGLIVSQNIYEGIDVSKWPNLGIERLEVSKSALDGLGIF
jgi:hypothetical protein